MTDDELDRRLRQALSAVPRPDLTARIRARIAEEPERPTAWRWTAAVTGGLAVASLVAMILTSRTMPPGEPFEAVAAPSGVAAAPDGVAKTEAEPSSTTTSLAPRAARRPSGPPVPLAPNVPALQLAPGDAEALRVLLAFSRAATISTEPDAPLATVDPLVLPIIDVIPIAVAPLTLADEIIHGGSQ